MRQNSKAGGWIAGTVFLSLLILAAAWFFGVSPLLQKATETRDQATAQLDQNTVTKTRIAKLKQQFENKDQLQADLVALREQIPTRPDLATYRREIAEIAAARGVTIVSVTSGIASSLAPAQPAAPAADDATATEDSAGTEAATEPTTGATQAPAAATPAAYAVPVTFDVMGSYDAVTAFLGDLQSSVKRLIVVEQLSGTAPAPAEAAGGKPTIVQGDLELVITGSVFILPEPAAATAGGDAGTGAQPTPLPASNGRNPLVTNG